MGRVFFPLDEELRLLPGNLAPRQHEHLIHLASWMPFAWAVRTLEHLLGVQVSEETARRLTEQAGARVEAAQTAQAKAPLQEEPKAKPVPARLAMSADGACVPLLHGEWAEVRTVAIGEVEAHTTAEGKQEVHVGHRSYFSRLTDAETFADLAEVEMRRRQVIQAEQVCAVTDGADWLQGFVDLHRSDAVRILDFPHAAEHVSSLLETLEKMGHHFPTQMLERWQACAQTSWSNSSAAHEPALVPRTDRTGRCARASRLSTQTRGTDAVPSVPTSRLANWLWHSREC